MKKAALVLVSIGLALAAGCGVDNQAYCEDYVDKVNAEYEECEQTTGTIDKEKTCPESLNEGNADCQEYYECLGNAYSCEESGNVEVDTTGCSAGCQ